MGNYADAIEEYEKAIKLDPSYADAYYNVATICEKLHTDIYLQKAIEYYKKYIKLVPAETNSINDKIYELEYLMEQKVKSKEHFESVLGFWKMTTHNQEINQSDCIIEIIPFQGKIRIKLLSDSKIYSNTLTNIVATTEVNKDNLLFTYTDNKNHVPNSAKWDALKFAGALVGGAVGGIGGDVISSVSNIAGDVAREEESAKSAQKFYDFYIDEFGTDTLRGFLHHFSSMSESKTGNIKILADDVKPVQFIRILNKGCAFEMKGCAFEIEVMCSDLFGKYRWTDAMQACPKGWRLPTSQELKCILENKKRVPGGFTGKQYWSSGTHPKKSDHAISRSLDIYEERGENMNKENSCRCVKDI